MKTGSETESGGVWRGSQNCKRVLTPSVLKGRGVSVIVQGGTATGKHDSPLGVCERGALVSWGGLREKGRGSFKSLPFSRGEAKISQYGISLYQRGHVGATVPAGESGFSKKRGKVGVGRPLMTPSNHQVFIH